ncbi:MAG: translational GTPase TypA [Desulfurellaceae bacterium]|nr:translational GTPase TypA [Desulfurellaceae bacterium]
METKNYALRNIAIIAHVDHGKTTLVDAMFKQSGIFRANEKVKECILDTLDLERERGITIMAKNTSVWYHSTKINIVDTPGHSDFSGEVERTLKMVDGVLLLVDAVEGPMPQTRFVLHKALEQKLTPIVVINKIDKKEARPQEVLNEIYDLFIDLDADEDLLAFPVIYAVGREGIAKTNLKDESKDLIPLFETIIKTIPAPKSLRTDTLQVLISNLSYDNYIGRLAIGRIFSGEIQSGKEIAIAKLNGDVQKAKIVKLLVFEGLKQQPVTQAGCGEIVAIAGIENIKIGETITQLANPVAMPPIIVDEPTLSMMFTVNKSPLAGEEGMFVTSQHLKERLRREALTNIAIKIESTDSHEAFKVSGRGELQLSVLIETMRREGYEFEVSKPEIITKNINDVVHEPIEEILIDIPEPYTGMVIELMSKRRGKMLTMTNHGTGWVRLKFEVPTRGLIGFRSEFLTGTKGKGTFNVSFLRWDKWQGDIRYRQTGALVSDRSGNTTAYALHSLKDRGQFFIKPVKAVYKKMIVGERNRSKDLCINVCRPKKLTNVRAASSDEAIQLEPPRIMSLENCIEFVNEDELIEVTPKNVRMRKC